MDIKEIVSNDELLVELIGTFDEMTSADLEDKLDNIFDTDKTRIRFDMKKVDYVSSAGIRVLILAHKKGVKNGKKILLGSMSEKVEQVFDMLGIMPLFKD